MGCNHQQQAEDLECSVDMEYGRWWDIFGGFFRMADFH